MDLPAKISNLFENLCKFALRPHVTEFSWNFQIFIKITNIIKMALRLKLAGAKKAVNSWTKARRQAEEQKLFESAETWLEKVQACVNRLNQNECDHFAAFELDRLCTKVKFTEEIALHYRKTYGVLVDNSVCPNLGQKSYIKIFLLLCETSQELSEFIWEPFLTKELFESSISTYKMMLASPYCYDGALDLPKRIGTLDKFVEPDFASDRKQRMEIIKRNLAIAGSIHQRWFKQHLDELRAHYKRIKKTPLVSNDLAMHCKLTECWYFCEEESVAPEQPSLDCLNRADPAEMTAEEIQAELDELNESISQLETNMRNINIRLDKN